MAIDSSVLERMVRDRALDMIENLAARFVEEVQGNAPRRTGELAESVKATDPVVYSDRVSVTVDVSATSDDGVEYGRFQDEGTGIFGPEGQPIRPKKRGGVLVFDWPAAGGVVFYRHVQGTEPTRFWTKAVEAWPSIVARASYGG